MSVWIDIKFAPKDATPVDLWGRWRRYVMPARRFTDCRFEQSTDRWEDPQGLEIVATHYMPLPAGPAPYVPTTPYDGTRPEDQG